MWSHLCLAVDAAVAGLEEGWQTVGPLCLIGLCQGTQQGLVESLTGSVSLRVIYSRAALLASI